MEMVGEEKPLHHVFKDYVAGGAAFGATRWISLLQRQCERLASELARNIADLGGMLSYHLWFHCTGMHSTWLLILIAFAYCIPSFVQSHISCRLFISF
jgi:hypothetical protein